VLSYGVRVAAGHLADNHAALGAFAHIDMVVARRPRGDQLKSRMLIEEGRVDLASDVDAKNFNVSLNLAERSRKSQIVLGKRSLEEILLGLLCLSEDYFHDESPAAFSVML